MVSNGLRIGLRMKSVSPPIGVQLSRIVPPGLKTARKRRAGAPCARVSRPLPMISSHGSAITTPPAPRKTARRLK
jgi:hypothetical protein